MKLPYTLTTSILTDDYDVFTTTKEIKATSLNGAKKMASVDYNKIVSSLNKNVNFSLVEIFDENMFLVAVCNPSKTFKNTAVRWVEFY